MIEQLYIEHDRLTAWLKANLEKISTSEFRRVSSAHVLVNDLVRVGGGTLEQRVAVMRKLNDIE